MKLGLVSDSLAHLGFEEMLDSAARLGLTGIELNTGGLSAVPHVDLQHLLTSAAARDCLLRSVASRGLRIVALNAVGNPLHPEDRRQADSLVDTLRLAGELGVDTVVTASGLPAGNATDTTPNWITNSWTPENQRILQYQWEEVLFPFWSGILALAQDVGVQRVALSLRGHQSVHNAHTLLHLRETVGPRLGASLDPSQQFLIGADPLRVIETLGHALYNVHATDLLLNDPVLATSSMIDTGSLTEVEERAWSFATPGYGHDSHWWARFCYRLTMFDYDGNIAAKHQDLVLTPMDSLHKTARLLRDVQPVP